MESLITSVVEGAVALIDLVVVPVANAIPFLASSGVLLAVFAALWIAFGVALVRDPGRLDAAWRRLRAQPVAVQAVAWLVLLPVVAGLWAWRTGWPRLARTAVVVGLAAWNLLVMVPRPV